MAQNFSELANLIWAVAELLRGNYEQADFRKVILPFTLLRRLDCVLEPIKASVLAENTKRKAEGVNVDPFLRRKSGKAFYNVSPFSLPGLLPDPQHARQNLVAYVSDFSDDARDVLERFKFVDRIAELEETNLLFQVVQEFAEVDLHPDTVPNEIMGLMFEEPIQKFAEASNEKASEHFTPREVIQLIVQCVFGGDDRALSTAGAVRSMYDPTAGTGGILSIGKGVATTRNQGAKLVLFGQELYDESCAICKADRLIRGEDPKNIVQGNTLSADGFPLDAIIALPNDLFHNTGIATCVWILDDHKNADGKGKVQLIDATRTFAKMKKSLDNKRVPMTDKLIAEIVKTYSGNVDDATFKNKFVEGYRDAPCSSLSATSMKPSETRPATRHVGRTSRSRARRRRHAESKTSRLTSIGMARNRSSAFVGVLGRFAPAGRRVELAREPLVVQLVRRGHT